MLRFPVQYVSHLSITFTRNFHHLKAMNFRKLWYICITKINKVSTVIQTSLNEVGLWMVEPPGSALIITWQLVYLGWFCLMLYLPFTYLWQVHCTPCAGQINDWWHRDTRTGLHWSHQPGHLQWLWGQICPGWFGKLTPMFWVTFTIGCSHS